MKILGGSASQRLAQELAKLRGEPLVGCEVRLFPDDEVYVRILDPLKGEDVVIVQTTYPSQKMVELLLLQGAAWAQGARTVTAVVPYFSYSRQDRSFQEGEVVSAKIIAEAIEARADRVVTIDPHKEHVLGFFGCETVGETAVPELAKALGHWGVDQILAPDKGALDRAQAAADALKVEFDHLEKRRISPEVVEITAKRLDVKGKSVAITDDIISTGGTIATAARELKRQGARRVAAACTHGLFLAGAEEKMRKAGVDAILSTDTIEGPLSVVSAAPAVSRALDRLA
ncbi:MAG: ribose-phosphate diphosphokinase [Thermoplasmatota archaeon]